MNASLCRHGVITAAAVLFFGCMGPRFGGNRSSIIEEGPECVGARTPGFWCSNQDGQNPNLTAEEFDMLAEQAAAFLSEVDELDTADEVAAAVCDTSNQLVRHLAATVLDLEANLISPNTPLDDVEGFDTVGEVVAEAIAILVAGEGDTDHAEDVKDILDDINNNANTILGDECVPDEEPFCGDGNMDEGEECDDGNVENGDGCSAECTIEEEEPVCGDGQVDEGEECDDGNTEDGDGCSAECTEEEEEPVCGDGQVDEGEECDDGNTEDGDGCSATCTEEEDEEPICGNGIVEGDEECDDGNTNDEDGCSRVCTEESN